MKELVEKVAQEIHEERFHALSKNQLGERWKLIESGPEGNLYRRQAKRVLNLLGLGKR